MHCFVAGNLEISGILCICCWKCHCGCYQVLRPLQWPFESLFSYSIVLNLRVPLNVGSVWKVQLTLQLDLHIDVLFLLTHSEIHSPHVVLLLVNGCGSKSLGPKRVRYHVHMYQLCFFIYALFYPNYSECCTSTSKQTFRASISVTDTRENSMHFDFFQLSSPALASSKTVLLILVFSSPPPPLFFFFFLLFFFPFPFFFFLLQFFVMGSPGLGREEWMNGAVGNVIISIFISFHD